jgi:hypothetical protein
VLRPELSNLRVFTLALGLPLLEKNRMTLGYHRFQQVHATPTMRNSSVDAELTGSSRDVGQEMSLVTQIRQWEDLEVDFIAGRFKAGRAFGAVAGEYSDRVQLKLIYEF